MSTTEKEGTMTKDLLLKARFKGQWHDRVVLENAINHIVGKLRNITKAALWLEIARKIELAGFDSMEEVERLSKELLDLSRDEMGQERDAVSIQSNPDFDILQERIRTASEFTVTLTNKEARILWRELKKLPPTAFGRTNEDGKVIEVMPRSAGLGIMFQDIADQLGFKMPEPPDDDEDEEDDVE
jgi:hypothetical protein